jgi:hypothetical protein
MVVLGLGWVATCWPWFVYWRVKERIWGIDAPALVDEPVFAVEPAHFAGAVDRGGGRGA